MGSANCCSEDSQKLGGNFDISVSDNATVEMVAVTDPQL